MSERAVFEIARLTDARANNIRRWRRKPAAGASLDPGTTVLLDNPHVQRHPVVREVIDSTGCVLRYLSASSPDVNPIELVVATLKACVRVVGIRSDAPLHTAIATADPSHLSNHHPSRSGSCG